jgi:hypothetical protein
VEPIRTDFSGYEGKFVAIDIRTGVIVLADEDYHELCRRLRETGLNRTAGVTRVPLPDEPTFRLG